MNKAIFAVNRIQNAMTCNRFLFWGGKVPVVKEIFSDRVFGDLALKTTVGRVALVLKWIQAFLGKPLYLFLCGVVPFVWMRGPELLSGGFPQFVQMLFCLSFLVGCFYESDILTPTLLKYTCVRQMYMNAGVCIAATVGKRHLVAGITFTPALMLAALVFGQNPLVGLLLSVELAATRLLAEATWLFLYDKMKRWPILNPWVLVGLIVAGIAAAYVPLLAGVTLRIDRLLTSPVGAVVILVAGALAARYLVRYPRYRALIYDRCKMETVLTASARAGARQILLEDVKLRDSDFDKARPTAATEKLRGYDYLNAMFFIRHRRMLKKPVVIELAAVGGVFLLGVVGVLLFPEEARIMLTHVPESLRFFVFFMYIVCNSLGTRICKAMFFNCDISLLRYGWYRERGVVLKNFTVRLKRLCAMNMALAGSICITVVALMLLAGVPMDAVGYNLPLFLLGILSLAVFFSVHPLFLYYVFQPYTAQVAVKNPFFSILNFVVYVMCYFCLNIRQAPAGFVLIVLSATALYCAVALLIVWKRAPATFRVK